jgi:general stress protein YciG
MSKDVMTENNLEEQITKARKNFDLAESNEQWAKSAHYDRKSNCIVVDLKNGASFMFPPKLAQGLAGASPEDLAEVELTPAGDGLHWETLDVDLSIPHLMAGIFGTKRWMSEIGRKGGNSTSEVKASAARENGKKGGRPPKQKVSAPKESEGAEVGTKVFYDANFFITSVREYRDKWASYECPRYVLFLGAGASKNVTALNYQMEQWQAKAPNEVVVFIDHLDRLENTNINRAFDVYAQLLNHHLDALQENFSTCKNLQRNFDSSRQAWADVVRLLSEWNSPRAYKNFIRASLIWDAAVNHLTLRMNESALTSTSPYLAEKLLEPCFAFSRFATRTIEELENAAGELQGNALSASLLIAEQQIKGSACLQDMAMNLPVERPIRNKETVFEKESKILDVFEGQQRELLSASYISIDVNYDQITALSPSASVAKQCSRCLYLIMQCNGGGKSERRKEPVKFTKDSLEAYVRLPWMVARDSASFAAFVTYFWTLCEWIGLDEEPYFTGDLPREDLYKPVWILKHLRDSFVHLGSALRSRKQPLTLGRDSKEALSLLGFSSLPDSPEGFTRLQQTLLNGIEPVLGSLSNAGGL